MLREHELTFESNAPPGRRPAYYANVRPRWGAAVAGALYEIDARDLAALDAYEEVGAGIYDRLELSVFRADGRREAALVYRMNLRGRPPRYGFPSDEQLRQIRAGYADWGLDRRALDAALSRINPHFRRG